ncbi:MAG: response regulator transcription factor [Kiritimatiellaeota bacterium]|nr:response regulator transcription factor [Kiritimatiellota bacterium]
MRILVADDDPVSRRLLEVWLQKWGCEVVQARDGAEAWAVLENPNSRPPIALLDWMMPEIDGVELCRRLRRREKEIGVSVPVYVVLVTALVAKRQVAAGLDAGADDYMTKPCDPEELRARVEVARRFVKLETALAERVRELEEAAEHIRTLQGILPICMYCKRIRNDEQYWQQVESYISERTEALFSHSICPECYKKHVEPQLLELEAQHQSTTDAPE